MDKFKIVAYTQRGTFESGILETEDLSEKGVGPASNMTAYQFDGKEDGKIIRFMEETIKNSVFEIIVIEEDSG